MCERVSDVYACVCERVSDVYACVCNNNNKNNIKIIGKFRNVPFDWI